MEKPRAERRAQASSWVCIFAELLGEAKTGREGLKNRVEIIFCALKIKLNLLEETNIAPPKNKTQEELRLFYIQCDPVSLGSLPHSACFHCLGLAQTLVCKHSDAPNSNGPLGVSTRMLCASRGTRACHRTAEGHLVKPTVFQKVSTRCELSRVTSSRPALV